MAGRLRQEDPLWGPPLKVDAKQGRGGPCGAAMSRRWRNHSIIVKPVSARWALFDTEQLFQNFLPRVSRVHGFEPMTLELKSWDTTNELSVCYTARMPWGGGLSCKSKEVIYILYNLFSTLYILYKYFYIFYENKIREKKKFLSYNNYLKELVPISSLEYKINFSTL